MLHRQNIDRIGAILDMAAVMEADRIELANTQYYGWAGRNRAELLPSRDQLERAETVVRAARGRLGDRMEIIYVIPDYYSQYPKPCMDGWARRQFTVVPNGEALPCPAAHELARGLRLPSTNVREHPLEWIWAESPLFKQFRGDEWMPDPCRSCDRREIDFGGCRCQAFALTGDAARTDPVCHLSPDHELVEAAVTQPTTRRDRGRRDDSSTESGPHPIANSLGGTAVSLLCSDPDRTVLSLTIFSRPSGWNDEAVVDPDRPMCADIRVSMHWPHGVWGWADNSAITSENPRSTSERPPGRLRCPPVVHAAHEQATSTIPLPFWGCRCR